MESGDHNSGTINKEDRGGAGTGLRRAEHGRGSLSQLWVLLSVAFWELLLLYVDKLGVSNLLV